MADKSLRLSIPDIAPYDRQDNWFESFAGKVKVTIRAESEKGFDKAKLQNGVLEPLREADLIE
jgi:hypothetical protein